jgi:hypothetical protein
MAFMHSSIEDTLKLLSNTETPAPKKRGRPRKKAIPAPSPVSRPASPVDTFTPFKTTTKFSSPISVQTTSDGEEHNVSPVTPDTKSETESSPVKETDIISTNDITKELTSKHLTVIRYIRDGDNLLYAVTYDPNGQVVFVELDSPETATTKGTDVMVLEKQDFIDYPFALREYYKDKLNGQMYGVVLTRGENMCLLTRSDDGDVEESFYGARQSLNNSINVYCVYKQTDISEDLDRSIQAIVTTYEMIQQRQLGVNKELYTETIKDVKEVYKYICDFDKIYQQYSTNILDDWSRFSNVANDYIDKFLEEDLTEDEVEKFSHIKANLFARFQAFNSISTTVCEISEAKKTLLTMKNLLKDGIEEFKNSNYKLYGKILTPDQVDILV